MSEYYKIEYKTQGNAGRIRSLIMSCINEDAALDNFKMAFGGQTPSIVSIKWVPRPGSTAATALASMAKPAPLPERKSPPMWQQPAWHKTA